MSADPDGVDWLLPIPGSAESVHAVQRWLASLAEQLRASAESLDGLKLQTWIGLAADGSIGLRRRLASTLLAAVEAHQMAADAVGRYADTLTDLQFRRKMRGLDVTGDLISLTVANADVARWREQAASEGRQAARSVGIARDKLDAVNTVFDELSRTAGRPPPGDRHRPAGPGIPAIPGGPFHGPRPRTNHDDGDNSSPYAAIENLSGYQRRLIELNAAVAAGHDVIFPIRGTPSWIEWRAGAGRDLGRLAR